MGESTLPYSSNTHSSILVDTVLLDNTTYHISLFKKNSTSVQIIEQSGNNTTEYIEMGIHKRMKSNSLMKATDESLKYQ